jgi:hypothetical protein
MHHTLRYGKHDKIKVLVYGDVTQDEKKTWDLLVERNALNDGFVSHEVLFAPSVGNREVNAL